MPTTLATDSDLQLALEVVGVFAFALSGGLVGVRRNLDLFGVLVLAWAAGLGGGLLRDLCIGAIPPVAVSDWRLLVTAFGAGVLVFVAIRLVDDVDVPRGRRRRLISKSVVMLDAAGLAVFAVSGALKALTHGAGPVAAVLLGVVTAVGGGLIRDVLSGQVPVVLQRDLYAVPALLGAAGVVAAERLGLANAPVLWTIAVAVFVLRVLAIRFDLHAPRALQSRD